jgi:PPOX class probable F420-dependent enzyme
MESSLNVPEWALRLARGGRVGHLGLLDDDGDPRVLPVTYVLHENELWSAVDDKPKARPGDQLARVRWLRARPRASLTVDVYDDDWDHLAWVQVVGHVHVLERPDPLALDALCDKYAAYRERAPGGPFLRLHPERASCWRAREYQEE